MKSAFYRGKVFHHRHIPRHHRFSYRFFMWFLHLDELDQVPDLAPWFSLKRFALSRFLRSDYLGPADEPLHISVKKKMAALTGIPVTGSVCGLMNLRTLGLYFSPVNFYFGYDGDNVCTHLLAEVSNTPWNERHYYAHDLTATRQPDNPKVFHVSPFNPVHQQYRWSITPPPAQKTVLKIGIYDPRGHIFDAAVILEKHPLTRRSVRPYLIRKPVMTAFIILGVYWQAARIFLKKIPYVPYKKESS
ncbi:MAG: DUF1365 domain-containing protein [Desulfotignum sp.]